MSVLHRRLPTVIDIEDLDADDEGSLGVGQAGIDRFGEVCAASDRPAAMILRDRDLVTPTDHGYHYSRCD